MRQHFGLQLQDAGCKAPQFLAQRRLVAAAGLERGCAVSLARWPILSSCLPTFRPGVSRSTMKLEMMTGANWVTVMEGKATKTK